MKRLSIALAAAALLAGPAAAQQSYPGVTIGKWWVNGADGACTAGAGYDGAHIIFVSADGNNEGILFLTGERVTSSMGDGSSLRLTIDGVAVTGNGSISDAPRGYLISYGMTSQMARLRDNPRFVLTKSGKPVFDVTLTDVSRVIGELLRCDAMVS